MLGPMLGFMLDLMLGFMFGLMFGLALALIVTAIPHCTWHIVLWTMARRRIVERKHRCHGSVLHQHLEEFARRRASIPSGRMS
jgi:hypothetical protein